MAVCLIGKPCSTKLRQTAKSADRQAEAKLGRAVQAACKRLYNKSNIRAIVCVGQGISLTIPTDPGFLKGPLTQHCSELYVNCVLQVR